MAGKSWIWMIIGRGKRLWCAGNYYRIHRKLCVAGSEMEAKKVSRFEGFLTKTKRAVTLGKVAVMGDFNINLDPTSTDFTIVTLRMMDKISTGWSGPCCREVHKTLLGTQVFSY